jgi:hypothetical protein
MGGVGHGGGMLLRRAPLPLGAMVILRDHQPILRGLVRRRPRYSMHPGRWRRTLVVACRVARESSRPGRTDLVRGETRRGKGIIRLFLHIPKL